MSVPSAEQRLNGGTAVEKVLERILVGARWIIVVPVLALLVGAGYFAFLSVYDVILGITSKDPDDGISEVL